MRLLSLQKGERKIGIEESISTHFLFPTKKVKASAPIPFTIYGKPQPKQRPRVLKRGFTYTPKETKEYEERIRWAALEAGCWEHEGPVALDIYAYFAIPKSEKGIEEGDPRTKRPDWDNLGKIVSDALEGVCYKEDSQVVMAKVVKMYSVEPRLDVVVLYMNKEDGGLILPRAG